MSLLTPLVSPIILHIFIHPHIVFMNLSHVISFHDFLILFKVQYWKILLSQGEKKKKKKTPPYFFVFCRFRLLEGSCKICS